MIQKYLLFRTKYLVVDTDDVNLIDVRVNNDLCFARSLLLGGRGKRPATGSIRPPSALPVVSGILVADLEDGFCSGRWVLKS